MSDTLKSTVIRGGTIFAHNGTEHCLLTDGVVVVEGNTIKHVGRHWDGPVDREIDARNMTVIPGQISTHAHIGAYEGPRCLLDAGLRKFVRSGFLHFLPTRRSTGTNFYSPSNFEAALRQGFASLLRHGITTVVDYMEPGNAEQAAMMVELARAFGIRLYWAPAISGGKYWLEDDGRVKLELDEKTALGKLQETADFIERYNGANDGLLTGIVTIDEYYVSTPELRIQAKKLADSLGTIFTLHFLEQHREFFDDVFATGKTSVQILADEGVLAPNTLLAHCVYVASHSLMDYPVVDDLKILGEHAVAVSHSPSGYARRGVMVESFDRYRAAGIRMTLGTDMYPLEMFTEMRVASTVCKMVEKNYEAAPAQAVFAASNIEGAKALGRDDLGKLAPGAKADIVIVDTDTLSIGHNPDPLKAFVHFAAADMVDTVMVDGRILVKDKTVLVCDEAEILRDVRESSENVWRAYGDYHPDNCTIYDHFPRSLPLWEGP